MAVRCGASRYGVASEFLYEKTLRRYHRMIDPTGKPTAGTTLDDIQDLRARLGYFPSHFEAEIALVDAFLS